MKIPIEDLTPREIVSKLDYYIIGQNAAKRAVAVALRNRYRRQQLPEAERADILPKNILMIGPTGVGKTEIARRVSQLTSAPFIKIEATKFTEVGYVGRDVESMIRDLVAEAVRIVEKEKLEQAHSSSEKKALEIIVNILDSGSKKRKYEEEPPKNPLMKQALELFGQKFHDLFPEDTKEDDDSDEALDKEEESARLRRRKRLLQALLSGKFDDKEIEIEVDEQSSPFVQVFTPQGLEEMGIDLANLGGTGIGKKRLSRKMTIADAKKVLTDQEARKSVDRSDVYREAVLRTEQTGVIFLDEMDKITGKRGSSGGPEVSREGVQRDLLPIIEGSTVATKYGSVRTDHILFIAAGAFHTSKPSDLIPELQGRLPIRVELENLSETDFFRILSEPKNALIKQYQRLLEVDGVEIVCTDDAIKAIAHLAQEVNDKTENIGARRLHTLLERLLDEILFDAPEIEEKRIEIDREFVRRKLQSLVEHVDTSHYIL